jgi:hypothetical protein
MHKPTGRVLTQNSFPNIRRNLTASQSSKTFSIAEPRQASNDLIFMREIEKKIEEQRKDLEERSLAIKTLLGHFENIASMCRDEKNKNIELRHQNIDLIKEIKHLKKIVEEKSLLPEKRQKNPSSISIINVDEYEGIWKENEKLKETIKKLEKDHQERFKEINGLHEQLTSLKHIIASLDKNISELNLDLNVAKSNKRKLEEEIATLRLQSEKLKENINERVLENEQLHEKISRINQDLESLHLILDEKEKEVQKVKNWNNKLSSQNQEFLQNKTKEGNLLCQIQIDPHDSLESIIDKFTKTISVRDEKISEAEKENLRLKDKINKGNIARKELLVSIEEFRNSNQTDLIKYEKLLQQLENTKKLKDSEIKDLKETITRIESQKKTYIEDLQTLEIQLFNERQTISQLSGKKEDLDQEVQRLHQKLEMKNEEILERNKKIEALQEVKLKFKLSQKEIKAVRDENLKLERINESMNEKYSHDKSSWTSEENKLQKMIFDLQEELNNEKIFNSIHLKELTKLKTALSAQDTRVNKDLILEEERRLKARIATLEMDLAEQKEACSKAQKNYEYNFLQVNEKSRNILELEEKLGKVLEEMKNPNFLQTVEKAKILKERENAVMAEISKISYAIEAFENGMTCIVCLACLDSPVLIVPCGHAVCNKCLDLRSLTCPQCSEHVQGQFRIDWLDQLVVKIVFQRQVLESMKQLMCKNLFI